MLLYWLLCIPLFILAGFCTTIAILDFNENIKLFMILGSQYIIISGDGKFFIKRNKNI